MDSSNAVLAIDDCWSQPVAEAPPAILRGTARGLEMVVNGRTTPTEIAAAIEKRLEEAPSFFRGSDVRISVDDGPLEPGTLGKLDALAVRFGLRIVEVAAVPVPKPSLAHGSAGTELDDEPTHTGSAPVPVPVPMPVSPDPVTLAESELTELVLIDPSPALDDPSFDEPTQAAAPLALATAALSELDPTAEGTRLVIGPVRSGVILDHTGHLFVFGDVNPGAEVRATGNIIVLGRLRGTAHAGIGQDMGFILALRLEPQQLRIGRQVARAGDDAPPTDSEIAYATGGGIVVERYTGKLPRNLATSI